MRTKMSSSRASGGRGRRLCTRLAAGIGCLGGTALPVWAVKAASLQDDAPLEWVSLILLLSGIALVGILLLSILLRRR